MLSVTGLWLAVSTHAKAVTDLPRRLVRRSFNSREACWRADRSNKASSAPACPSPIDVYPKYDESSVPSVENYMKDPEYPVDLSRRSSKNEDGLVSA